MHNAIHNLSFYSMSHFILFHHGMCRHSLKMIDPHKLTLVELEKRHFGMYQTSLVPLCQNNSLAVLKNCSDFKPAVTNAGMCFARNGGQTDKVFKQTSYMEIFKRVFLPGRDQDPVLMNKGSGPKFQFSFVIDGHRTMDLKDGVEWNNTKALTFNLAIHPTNNQLKLR